MKKENKQHRRGGPAIGTELTWELQENLLVSRIKGEDGSGKGDN